MGTVLILSVASTSDGLCLAVMTTEPHPASGLRWVRPIPERGSLRIEDLTTSGGETIRPFDVIELNLLKPRPRPPHTEDWIADFERDRPRIVRRLEGERRSGFLHKYCDAAPRQVLESQQRALCLIEASSVTGSFRQDPGSAHLDARLSFRLGGRAYRGSFTKGGLAVTDLEWLALAARWLPEGGGWAEFDEGLLEARLGIEEVFLVIGLSRSSLHRFESVILGVHTVPEYEVSVTGETA
jgi:hypothetical protein